ncbi:MAG: single-stranded-DNA-specific exonuclease RecJ [Pirellulaceae bacterium]
MAKRWKVSAHDRELVSQICSNHNVPPIVAKVLANREITDVRQLDSFFDLRMTCLRPPEQLPGVTEAVDAILDAVANGKRICVYGDYDCDGMTSTAIMLKCLQQLGANTTYFVPNRIDDGYGLNCERIRELAGKGVEFLISVDCGVASLQPAKTAKELGIPLVVTDHHLPGETLPDVTAIVHPGLPGGDYPFSGLCGAGVAFKLAWALCKKHSGSEKLPPAQRDMLFQALSLAAIGTIADVVPLVDENRILVHHGLKRIAEWGGLGVNFLMQHCKLAGKAELSAEDVGFMIAPRLNASGRLGQAQLGVELLVCDQASRAEQLAAYIDNLNKSRDSLERSIIREANKMLQSDFDPTMEPALVLAHPKWHPGVIGIVAGRLAEKHNRPTIVLSMDPMSQEPATGSGRSASGLNLYEALHACRSHLKTFGGHAAAAGLKIQNESIDQFREDFCEFVRENITAEQQTPELQIDAEVALCELTSQSVFQLESLAPFGNGNPRPVLCAHQVQVVGEPQTMGTDGRHLAVRLGQDDVQLRAVAFGAGEWSKELMPNQCYDFAFKPVINDFRGLNRVELQLVDFRPAQQTVAI